MPGITNPAEEYFKDGAWAWDPAAKVWLKLIIDPLTDRLMVDPGDDFEVHQTTPADLTPGIHGWDGSTWRKLPMVWGYSGVLTDGGYIANSPGVNHDLDSGDVDAGEVWVVKGISAQDVNNAFDTLTLGFNHNGSWVWVKREATIAANQLVAWVGEIVLDVDDYIRATFSGVTINDDLYLYVWGYKMKIAE